MCLKTISVLTSICLTLLLSSCGNKPVITKTVYQYPPQAYLVVCERSQFAGKTYKDAIEHLITVTAERDTCASQIDGIRRWQKQHTNK
ncbi:Rz1-like lysis system protein LysC [Actinobacillus pleuropneumoniae]|uniref:Rz1-like lysis system protein LysC n=1 Tax=Actinobacillus pleuropneumoniae TaxID=715 RepID=UPI003D08CD07